MKKEFQEALRGIKQPLALHQRAMMLLVGFAFVYLILWVLHLLYAAKHYGLLVIALLLLQVVGVRAERLFRMAVLSPPKSEV